jgi:CHAT domain-containing protein/tetratricopeptide (TPR) repeat protein
MLAEAAQLEAAAERLRAQAAFDQAEPLYVRALDLRERALGPRHTDVGRSLGQLGALRRDRSAYSEAEPLLVRALDIAEHAGGPLHPDLASRLDDLGELQVVRGAYDQAESLLVRALHISESARGPWHPDVARSLRSLGELYRIRGAYEQAEPLALRALEIDERALEPTDPEIARSLGRVAALHVDRGAYEAAESELVRSRQIAEAALGPRHPEVARAMNDLAVLYRIRGAYDKAQALQTRALDIAEHALGPMHTDVAQELSNLAVLYWIRGAYARADALHSRALDIRERVLGPMHDDVARSLTNLAIVRQDRGAAGDAESLYLRALDIHEKVLRSDHPLVSSTLISLSTLYYEQGAYGRAEPLLARAIEIAEHKLGPMHPMVAAALCNLAAVHQLRGDYAAAEPLLIRAIGIVEKTLGPGHDEISTYLTNLAWLYRDQRLDRKAEPLMIQALDIHEKALGPNHPRGALKLYNLGALYRDQRAYRKAEPLVLRALAIDESALGPLHPEVASGLRNVARLYWARGTPDRAVPLMARSAEIREAQLRVELPRLSEPRKRAVMAALQDETDSLVSLHAHAVPYSDRALELALTTVVRRKGRVLDSMVDGEAALRAHLTPELREQFDQLDGARTELVARLYTPREKVDGAAVAAIRARIERLEARLSAESAVFRVQSEPVTLATIQAAIPRDAVLVELVRYHRIDPREIPASREERYLAYLLQHDGSPHWIPLGPAAPIDAQIDAVLAAMDDGVPTAVTRTALRRLDALVLAPIRARLAGAPHLILAPDGKLNLVPFEALLDPRGHHALESHLISYLTTGRDLLRLAVPAGLGPRSAATLVAAPNYGPPAAGPGAWSFPPLANALAEASDLRSYFTRPPLTGDKASKSALRDLTGPAILHVATHGFYARAGAPRPAPTLRAPSREVFADPTSDRLPPPGPDDPADGLDRAGLALAGANQGSAGIVTAREIAGFDWWGTQLIVLSACETGVGAVPSGDGVYGLRRALVLAGAVSQVVSLWSVDDASTRQLMRNYYAELAIGTGRAEALRRAKLQLLHQPRHAHPRAWAAFIPVGDWRPLDKDTIPQRDRAP